MSPWSFHLLALHKKHIGVVIRAMRHLWSSHSVTISIEKMDMETKKKRPV